MDCGCSALYSIHLSGCLQHFCFHRCKLIRLKTSEIFYVNIFTRTKSSNTFYVNCGSWEGTEGTEGIYQRMKQRRNLLRGCSSWLYFCLVYAAVLKSLGESGYFLTTRLWRSLIMNTSLTTCQMYFISSTHQLILSFTIYGEENLERFSSRFFDVVRKSVEVQVVSQQKKGDCECCNTF